MTLIYLQAGESTPANVRLRDPTTAPSAGAVIFGWQSDDAPLARKLRGGVEAYSPPVPPAAAPSVALALDGGIGFKVPSILARRGIAAASAPTARARRRQRDLSCRGLSGAYGDGLGQRCNRAAAAPTAG